MEIMVAENFVTYTCTALTNDNLVQKYIVINFESQFYLKLALTDG